MFDDFRLCTMMLLAVLVLLLHPAYADAQGLPDGEPVVHSCETLDGDPVPCDTTPLVLTLPPITTTTTTTTPTTQPTTTTPTVDTWYLCAPAVDIDAFIDAGFIIPSDFYVRTYNAEWALDDVRVYCTAGFRQPAPTTTPTTTVQTTTSTPTSIAQAPTTTATTTTLKPDVTTTQATTQKQSPPITYHDGELCEQTTFTLLQIIYIALLILIPWLILTWLILTWVTEEDHNEPNS